MAEIATATATATVTATKYEMTVPSYRGKPGLSSATNSSRSSLISHFHEKDKQMKQMKEMKEKENQNVNVSNKKSRKQQKGGETNASSSTSSSKNSKNKDSSNKDSNTNSNSKDSSNSNSNSNKDSSSSNSSNSKNKNDSNPKHRNHKHRDPENLLPEIDRIRGIGVGKDNATPQELYAIGAVFDHIYRGGSPMNCIDVFRKEVNRAPHQKTIGCGFGFGPEGDDDDTLPTMDWTHNRSYADTVGMDLYTLDEDGTYIRSFMSRDESIQSTLDAERARALRMANKANAKSRDRDRDRSGSDPPHPPHQPWDESTLNTTGAKIGGIYSNNKKKAPSTAYFSSEMSGIKRGKAKSSERRNQHHDQHRKSSSQPHRNKSVFDDTSQSHAESIETMERLKIWSEVLLAAAKEAVMDDDGTESGRSEGPTINCAGTNISSLVRMFRSTVEENIPEETKASTTALSGALVRVVSNNLGPFGRNSDGPYSEDDDYTCSTDDSYSYSTFISARPRPLNSLAKAMRSIAKKEPSRTYAASEQDQVVGRQQQQQQQQQQGEATTIPPATPTKSKASNPATSPSYHRGPASVGTSVESEDTPPPRDPRKRKPSRSPPSKRNAVSGNSVGGISVTDTDGVGSHRGDAVSILPKVPSSIGVPRSTSTSSTLSVLQDLFTEPTRVATASSAAAIPHRRSFFKRRESENGGLGDSAHGKPIIPVSQASSSPRRNLPPVPPARSPTTPSAASPSRNLHLSSDNDGTELSIIGFSDAADTTTVVTPPRSTGAPVSSSSPKSTSGISIKKLVSFRKRKPTTPTSTKYHDHTANPNSPRSAMGVNTQIFQVATDSTSAYYEESVVACIADETMDGNESIVVTPMRFQTNEEETSSTDGLLLTQSNEAASSEYEVQSV